MEGIYLLTDGKPVSTIRERRVVKYAVLGGSSSKDITCMLVSVGYQSIVSYCSNYFQDNSTTMVLREIAKLNSARNVKVHSISFNCDDRFVPLNVESFWCLHVIF